MNAKNYTYKFLILLTLVTSKHSKIFAQQSISGSFTSGGQTRSYIGAEPNNPESSLRLVILFCGATENASQMELRGFNNFIGDNTIVIYPEPVNTTFGFDNTSGIDDYQMVEDLILDVSTNYPIDVNDICIGGFSNGALFTYNLICDFNSPTSTRPYAFKSFAIVSGAMEVGSTNSTNCPIANELPVIVFHGTNDPIIPYNGGTVGFPLNITSESTETTVNFWANDINTCSSNPTITSLPDINSTDGSTVDLLSYDCSTSEETLLYRINGGFHAWPSGNANFDTSQGRNLDINASELISQFFENPTSLSTQDYNSTTNQILIYPNPVQDILTIEYPNNIKSIELINSLGRKVIKQKQGDKSLSLTHLTSGIYFLHIETDNGKTVKKILKQ